MKNLSYLQRIFALILLALLLASQRQVEAKRYSSGGNRSYSSSSRSSYSRGSSSSSVGSTFNSKRSSYSSGGAAPKASNSAAPQNKAGWDSSAAQARSKQASSSSLQRSRQANTPPPLPSTPRYSPPRTRPPMLQNYASRPAVVYQDRFDALFWYWLLDQSLSTRAQWVVHHQASADPERIKDLYAADAKLKEQVEDLKKQIPQPNPDFVPEGLPKQEMFTEEPTEPFLPAPPAEMYSTAQNSHGSSHFFWVAALGSLGGLTWLIFFKRWQPNHS